MQTERARVSLRAMQDFSLRKGRATPEGTRRFAARFPELPGHFRRPDRLYLSSIGMGTKPGSASGADDLLYRTAVPHALERGVNVFDTALSYRMMSSERALGASLGRAFDEGKVERDEVYVISKGGYLTVDPHSPLIAGDGRRYLVDTYIRSGLVDPEGIANGVHSLDPLFLADQIERSRSNLGLATLDLYCVQEPELQLLTGGPNEFRTLLVGVIETLEEAVARGAIAAYGLSTWSGLLTSHLDRGHLSIVDLFQLALEVGGPDNHLCAVQLPYNLAMCEAQGLKTQIGPEGYGAALETLMDTGTTVFATVPLAQGRAVRGLPEFVREAFPGLRTDAQRCLQFARSAPGVTTALVGMRQTEHVEENLATAEIEPAPPEVIEALFERAREEA